MLALSFDRGIDSSEERKKKGGEGIRNSAAWTWPVGVGGVLVWPGRRRCCIGPADLPIDLAEMRAELGPAAACGLDRPLVRNRRPIGLGHLRRFRSLVRWCSAVRWQPDGGHCNQVTRLF
jgi:hypothetical protein